MLERTTEGKQVAGRREKKGRNKSEERVEGTDDKEKLRKKCKLVVKLGKGEKKSVEG